MLLFVMSGFSQESNLNLLFQYYGINENQFEIDYISGILERDGITSEMNLETSIVEAHNYFVAHQEEIQTEVKANELMSLIKIGEKEKAEFWSQALSSISSYLSSAIPAAIEAGNQQQVEYQKKINRDKDIQAYIAQHSSNTPKQYTQVFGDMPTKSNAPKSPRVTTSNGLEEPLPSAKSGDMPTKSNAPKSPRVTTSNGLEEPLPSAKSFEAGAESEVMGVKVENGVRQSVRLKVNGDRLEGYWQGDPFAFIGERSFCPVGKNGYPTDNKRDGELSKLYKYVVDFKIPGSGIVTIYY